jgi:hypothetical protein
MPTVIEGSAPKTTKSDYLNDLLNKQTLEIVEPNERVNSNGNKYEP